MPIQSTATTPWPDGKSEHEMVPSWNSSVGPEKLDKSPSTPEEPEDPEDPEELEEPEELDELDGAELEVEVGADSSEVVVVGLKVV